MYKIKKVMFMIAQTPVHAGSGSDTGVIDLPIQREKHTTFPKIEASSLKGCIREAAEKNPDKGNYIGIEHQTCIDLVFGPEDDSRHAGAISFTDARILLFPVKSVKGVFAWVTCPSVLNRFNNDMKIAESGIELPVPPENSIAEGSVNLINKNNSQTDTVVMLEEFLIKVKKDAAVKELAQKISNEIGNGNALYKELVKRLVVLSDDDFRDFVNLSTEVITRTKINNTTGTVETGALFNEEYLPAEIVMYSIVMAAPLFVEKKEEKEKLKKTLNDAGVREEEFVMGFLQQKLPAYVQIGGNSTLGKGIMSVRLK